MRRGLTRGGLALCGALTACALAAPIASADVTSVFDDRVPGPSGVPCQVRDAGLRFCEGTTTPADTRVRTFDGIPLDANVTLPAEPASGEDGDYPLIVQLHGYGQSKSGYGDTRSWAERGYAVLSYSARGFGNSCGAEQSRLPDPAACAKGWIHLADARFEARDTQELAGLLADEEADDATSTELVNPEIGVTGLSYGGGQTIQLAALKDRIFVGENGLEPWKSPEGKDMRIAAAAPEIPWSDLPYSLVPNGRTLDYRAENPYDNPYGVLKSTFVAGLFASGENSGFYAPPGIDPDADLRKWFPAVNAGEPYDGNPVIDDIVDELTKHHSGYYIDDSRPPAPLFIANGFTDDLFPVDEALRFENKTRAKYGEGEAPISLMFLDYGHMRGQNKAPDLALKNQRIREWFDFYLKGEGGQPSLGVETLTQTCGRPSEGPFSAATWDELSKGEVRFSEAAGKTIASAAGNPAVGRAFDPVAGGGACATTSAADQPETATYRLPAAQGGGYTLMGSPTVIADIASPFPNAQVAARLLDVAPDGTQRLVARALYRPNASGRQVFQLHGNGYKFEAGHVAKLELLGKDEPYGRPSNGAFTIGVSNLELRLPVLEAPDGGAIKKPAANVSPDAGGTVGGGGGDQAPRCDGRVATVVGTSGDDELTGTSGPDVMKSRGGTDTMKGLGAGDVICSGRGKDDVAGGKGRDRVFGQSGNDHLGGARGRDRIEGGSGEDRLRGGKGRDKLVGDGGRDRCNGGSSDADRAPRCEKRSRVP